MPTEVGDYKYCITHDIQLKRPNECPDCHGESTYSTDWCPMCYDNCGCRAKEFGPDNEGHKFFPVFDMPRHEDYNRCIECLKDRDDPIHTPKRKGPKPKIDRAAMFQKWLNGEISNAEFKELLGSTD